MTGILPAARVSTMHPHTHDGIYDTAGAARQSYAWQAPYYVNQRSTRMPRGPSYVLNSYIDMIFQRTIDTLTI